MAAVLRRQIPIGTQTIFIVETEHPHTANYDPDEQEERDEALEARSTSAAVVGVGVFSGLVLLLALEAPLEYVNEGLGKAEHSKDNQPNDNTMLPIAIVKVHRT